MGPPGCREDPATQRAPPALSLPTGTSKREVDLLKASSRRGAEAICLHPRVSLVVQGHTLASEKPCFSLPFYEHSFW